jgi:hypothetical protein
MKDALGMNEDEISKVSLKGRQSLIFEAFLLFTAVY